MGSLINYNLAELKEKYDTPIFIETGTAFGDGIKHALKFNFDKIISIEIMINQANLMKEYFQNDKNVEIICGNSLEVFERLLPYINENAIFWLDAHYPGADLISDCSQRLNAYMAEKNDDIRLPLEKELELIKSVRVGKKDVILLDDLNIYRNEIGDDAYYLKPKKNFRSNFFKEIFIDTHDFNEVGDTQGILTPKIVE